MKSKDLDGCAKLKERAGDYSGAVKLFVSHNRRIDALGRAHAYESQGLLLEPDVSVAQLAHTFAKVYAKQKNMSQLVKVLEYVADISQKIRFLKEAHLYDKACEVHVQKGQLAEAYRILSAQAKYTRGIELAQEQGDEKILAKFVFQKAIADIVRNAGTIGDSEVVDRLTELSVNKDLSLQAKACLLLGKSTGNAALCSKAVEAYKTARNAVGEIEGFCALIEQSQQMDNRISLITMAIEACKAVQAVAKAIECKSRLTATGASILHQVEDFYGLQKQGTVYCTPRGQDLWIGTLEACAAVDSEPDTDGMLRLDVLAVRKEVKKHVEKYVVDWLEKRLRVKQTLKSKLSSFTFHKELHEGQGHLKRSYSAYPSGELKSYLQYCLLSLEVSQIEEKYFPPTIIKTILLNFFTPQAAMYLPVGRLHISMIRDSSLACKLLEGEAADVIGDGNFRLDEWLETWRIYCILGRGVQRLESVLTERARLVNVRAGKTDSKSKQGTQGREQELSGSVSSTQENAGTDTDGNQKETTQVEKKTTAECDSAQVPCVHAEDEQRRRLPSPDDSEPCTKSYKPPFAYVYNAREDRYDHVFLRWLKSCALIKSESRVIVSAKIIVRHFCHIIADRRNLRRTISVANLINILTVHSMALLAIALQCRQKLKCSPSSTVIVPNTYPHVVQNFDDLNCQDSADKCLFRACVEEVQQGEKDNSLSKLRQDAFELLGLILNFLIGKYKRCFTLLRFAVTQKHSLQNAEADYCLVLALTLFGNLAGAGFFSGIQVLDYQKSLCEALSPLARLPEPQHLKQAQSLFASASDVAGTFLVVSHILSVAGRSGNLVQFKLSQKSGKVKSEFAPISLQHLPHVPFLVQAAPPQSPAQFQAQVGQAMLTGMSLNGLPPVLRHSLQQAGMATAPLAENHSQISPQIPITVPLLQPLTEPFQSTSSATMSYIPMPASLSVSTQPLTSAPSVPVAPFIQTPSFPDLDTVPKPFPESQNPEFQMGYSRSTALPPGFGLSPHPLSRNQICVHPTHLSSAYFTGPSFVPGDSAGKYSHGMQNRSPMDLCSYLQPQGTEQFRSAANMEHSPGSLAAMSNNLSWPSPTGKSPDTSQHADENGPEMQVASGIEDEEIQQVLAFQSDSFLPLPSPPKDSKAGSNAPDVSMVDESFCRICAVSFTPNTGENAIIDDHLKEDFHTPVKGGSEVAGRAAATSEIITETYHAHLESKSHKLNTRMYEEFSMAVEWEYYPYREELSSMLREYSTMNDIPFALDVAINDTKVEIAKNDQRIEEVKRSCSWREGLFEIRNEMTDRMKFLMKALSENRRVSLQQRTVNFGANSEGYRLEDEEELEIEQSTAAVVEGEKLEKRRKKKHRKHKIKK